MTKQLAAFAAVLACASCGSGLSTPAVTRATSVPAPSPIEHVVFIIQENRSFNNLFMSFPGATTARFGYDTKGRKIRLHAESLGKPWDLGHSASDFFAACDGRGHPRGTKCEMDGWNRESATPNAPADPAYAYVPRDDIAPYWTIARDYVLADRAFASNLDGSFIAHQYSVAAYASRAVDYPVGAWGCEGGRADTIGTLTEKRTAGAAIVACFENPTIANEADEHGLRWRFYTGTIYGDGGLWSSYQADKKIYSGPDWKNDVVSPQARFLTDVAKGKLANITWITPSFLASDHPGANCTQGPQWIASLVNAIGTSRFWNSTAIFIMWDDWGGFFDPVAPPYEDYDGLGFRVPLLVVSPYAKRGYVSHVQYETTSVLRFIEDTFGLPQLAASDARANDPAADAFDFASPPRAFVTIPGGRPAAYWLRQARASHVPRLPHGVLGDD